MFVRAVALLAAVFVAGPAMWRYLGPPWPSTIWTWNQLLAVAQLQPEQIISGAITTLAWTMWILLAAYAATAVVSAIITVCTDTRSNRN